MKQIKLPSFVGAVLVQYSYSSAHIGVLSMAMLSVTLWALVGPSVQNAVPWVEYWHFTIAGLITITTIMLVDYIFLYPTRQAYLNKQAVKHANPAYREIMRLHKRLDAIEKKLEIEND